MSNLSKIQDGAAVLQEVDVSDIFTSLAMGIADAQKKLDDNSIAQIIKLSDNEIGGRSLLELGFTPAFYNFTYADISASIHIKMKMKDEFALAAQLKAEYDSDKQGKTDYRNIQKEEEFNSEKTAFISSRKFRMKSDTVKSVTINENHFKFDESEKVVTKIDSFHTKIIQLQDVERLNISVLKKFITHYTPQNNFTILKISDYSNNGNNVEINESNDITIKGKDFSTVFPSGGDYGFSKTQVYGLTPSPQELNLHFGFDKRIINFKYSQGDVNNNDKIDVFDALASILREDSSAKILIKGHTDRRGPDDYNNNLSKDRCNAMRDWLIAKGAKATQINIEPKGESLARANDEPDGVKNVIFRKVTIEVTFGSDYIYFSSVLSSPTPDNVSNFFITNTKSSDEIKSSSENVNKTDFFDEEREGIIYHLEKDTQIEFSAYSNTSKEIKISKEEEEGTEDEIKIAQNERSSELLLNNGNESNSNNTVALGLNVDVRMAKQFEMSVEGNSSMSARMVSTPPPEGFVNYVNSLTNSETD